MSSSSDFSSDEEDAAFPDPSLVPRVVAVEPLDDAVGSEPETDDAAALVASLRTAPDVPDALVQALAPLLEAQSYSYDAYTAALYYLSALWPEQAPAATQRALAAARRELFKRFQRAFPLTPELYGEYIGAEETVPHKLRLYEQASRDYWSVALTIEHLQLLAEHQDEVPGVDWAAVERAMETALATVGTHYTAGHDVWKTARELTAQHLDEDDAAKELALRGLFARQMRLPLQQNDLVMSELRAWLAYNTPAAARDAALREAEQFQQRVFGGAVYKKLNQLEERLSAALAGTPPPSAKDTGSTESESPEKVWTQYLRYAQFKLAPLLATPEDADRYVVGLFERAVASVCLSSALWSQYIEYLASHKKSPSELLLVAQRATRNASFDSAFWVERLVVMEASGASVQQVREMIETDLMTRTTPPLMDSAHTARVLTNYCGAVRRISSDASDAVDAAIAHCERFLETAFGAADESALAALRTFQAQFYAFQLCTNAGEDEVLLEAKWRETWVEILRIRGAQAEVWLSFYDEYRFTHASSSDSLVQELRDEVFAPATQQVQDYPLLILERWLAFELGVGDRAAYTRVREQYQREVQRLTYQASSQAATVASQASVDPVAKEKPVSKKRKPEAATAEPAKRQKATKPEPPTETLETKKKAERFTNDHTLFVCNVPKEVTKDELQALFAFVPTLREVRLVVKERGNHVKSRGMAYVQFSDDAGVTAGLALDGTLVHGQPIKVERSTPPPSGSNSKPNAKTGTNSDAKGPKATTTVYVGGLLPPEKEPITEDQLKAALTEVLGEAAVKQVLILTDRRGRPKDYGLVEVADVDLVGVAVKKQHELQLKLGDQVTVKTSRMTIDQVVRHRDEQKQATQQAKAARQVTQQPPERPQKPSGGFQAKTAPHSKPHARLAAPTATKPKPLTSAASLMPRALRKKTASVDAPSAAQTTTSAATATTGAAETTAAPKSNEDFRKLFLS